MSDDWLSRAARDHPRRPALVVPGGELSYRELAGQAGRAARELRARGVRAGLRVAITLPAGPAFVEALHACLRLGAVAVPLDLRLPADQRAAQAAGCALVIDRALDTGNGRPAEAQAETETGRDPDAPAIVVHTSGTTRVARTVELTRANWEAAAHASAQRLGHPPDERWLCTLPLSHVGGLSILVRSAIHATTAVLHERFDTEAVAAALTRDVTIVSLVPTTLSRLLEAGARPGPQLRCALVGGAPLAPALATRALDAGFPVARTYGCTEACSQVATSEIGDPRPSAEPLPGTTVAIGADGEILVRGPTVAPGEVAGDGWLHTADRGSLDAAGRLTVTGRLSEMIVTGGENVSPAEVEAVLETHPAVAEAAVRGRPDPEWGETVVATVVVAPGHAADARALRAHCLANLPAFKVPKAFETASTLPRTVSGKVRRADLQ